MQRDQLYLMTKHKITRTVNIQHNLTNPLFQTVIMSAKLVKVVKSTVKKPHKA